MVHLLTLVCVLSLTADFNESLLQWLELLAIGRSEKEGKTLTVDSWAWMSAFCELSVTGNMKMPFFSYKMMHSLFCLWNLLSLGIMVFPCFESPFFWFMIPVFHVFLCFLITVYVIKKNPITFIISNNNHSWKFMHKKRIFLVVLYSCCIINIYVFLRAVLGL